MNVFDIIGPVMIGPSSSHTAGAVSHFAIGGAPNWTIWILCVVFTFIWARIAAVFANKAEPKTLNQATGVVLVILGAVIFVFSKI